LAFFVADELDMVPGKGAMRGLMILGSQRAMKISPLHGRGAGVGCPQLEGPTPEGYAFCPSSEGIFTGAGRHHQE